MAAAPGRRRRCDSTWWRGSTPSLDALPAGRDVDEVRADVLAIGWPGPRRHPRPGCRRGRTSTVSDDWARSSTTPSGSTFADWNLARIAYHRGRRPALARAHRPTGPGRRAARPGGNGRVRLSRRGDPGAIAMDYGAADAEHRCRGSLRRLDRAVLLRPRDGGNIRDRVMGRGGLDRCHDQGAPGDGRPRHADGGTRPRAWRSASVELGRGELGAAEADFATVLAFGQVSESLDFVLPPMWGLAEVALQAGEPERAVAICRERPGARRPVGERVMLIPFVVTGVRAVPGGGPAERRRRVARGLRDAPRRRSRGSPGQPSTTAVGWSRSRTAPPGSLGPRSRRRSRGWDDRGRVWEATWARLDLAQCLIRSNRFAEALALAVGRARHRLRPRLAGRWPSAPTASSAWPAGTSWTRSRGDR